MILENRQERKDSSNFGFTPNQYHEDYYLIVHFFNESYDWRLGSW